MSIKYIEELFAELEAEGHIVRNGKFRRNRKGELKPVYIMTEKGERKAEEEALEANKTKRA
jgi:hypothetical protein